MDNMSAGEAKLRKEALINNLQGFRTKCMYRDEKSINRAIESYINFNGLTAAELTPTSMRHKFTNHAKMIENIQSINPSDWYLVLQIFEWDEYINEIKGAQLFKLVACNDYKVWNVVDLDMIDRNNFVFLFKTNQTKGAIHSMLYSIS